MNSLNTIPNSGSFGDVSAKLNDNFSKVGQSLTTLENVVMANKGYFDTLASLQAAFPSPKDGNIAYVANVASSTGYYIYNVVSGVWTATTTEAPSVDVAISNYAQHGYSSSPKTLKQVDDEVVQLAGDVTNNTTWIGYNDSIEKLKDAETNILKAWEDSDGRIVAYVDSQGIFHAPYFDNADLNSLKHYREFIDTVETITQNEFGILKAWTDSSGRIVAYIDNEGIFHAPHLATLTEKKTSKDGRTIAVWSDDSGRVVVFIDENGVVNIPHLKAWNFERENELVDKLAIATISNTLTAPFSEAALERAEDIVFRNTGSFAKEAVYPVKLEPVFTIGDDDTIDNQLRFPYGEQVTGGFLSLLYPVCASLGITATEAMEGWRCGFLEGELNKTGRVALDLQKKAGWEIACHTMTARFGHCYAVQSIAEAEAFPDHPVSQGGGLASNNIRRIFVIPEQKNYYWAVPSVWKEIPREYIPPFISDYSTQSYIGDNPAYPMEYQYGDFRKIAAQLGFDEIKHMVVVAATHSHRKRREMKKWYKSVYSNSGFSTDGTYYIKPPLCSAVKRQFGFELGESDMDNTATDVLFDNNWKLIIDQAIAEKAYMNINLHMYRPCWVNKIDSELVSNGGTYPDEWVFPVDDPDTNLNYLAAPKPSTGLTRWDQWHPCPGTRLYQLWRMFTYIRDNARFVSHDEFYDRYRNIFEIGDWTNGQGKSGNAAAFDETDYDHYVIGVDGQETYLKKQI